MRRLLLVVAVLVAVVVAILATLLGANVPKAGDPAPTPTPTTTTSDEPDPTDAPSPTGVPGDPSPTEQGTDGEPSPTDGPSPTDDPDAIERFREACLDETRALTAAFVSFESAVELTVDEPSRFTVRISGEATPTSSASPDVRNQPVAVSCIVQARLVASGTDLDVSPEDWVEQRYLPPEPSSWTWVVTAQDAGESAAVLQMKPTIRVAHASGEIAIADLRTEEFDVSFNADRTPGAVFTSLWTGILALAAGVTTLVGTYFALRRLRKRDATLDEEDEPATP